MIPQNKIVLKGQAQQSSVVATIKSYLSYSYFRIATHFESRTQINLPYVNYLLSKLPEPNRKKRAEERVMQLLVGGLNRNVKVGAQLIRMVQYEYKVFCLAWDKFQQQEARFFPIAIIFPDTAKAEEWCSHAYFLAFFYAFDPFVTFNSHYKSTLLIVRHDNVEVYPSKEVTVKDWQKAKGLANDSFKLKKYKLALVQYEMALGLLCPQSLNSDRAILHSNAAQSFFQLNLSQNTLMYADTAIILDPSFVKSYYRKLCSLLELQEFQKIPQVLMLMAKVCSKEEFTTAHERYTRYMANQTGIYNWIDIIIKRSSAFGQYSSCKIKLEDTPGTCKPRRCYVAKSLISKYELVAVQKAAIYAEENCTVKKNNFMRDFFDDIYELLQLEQRFSERIVGMLKEVGKREENMDNDIAHTHTTQAIFHSHCFKTLFVNESNIGICPEYTRFLIDEETPNCTFLSLQGGFFYFAVRDIQPNEILSIQLFNKILQSPHPSLQIFSSTSQRGLEAYYAHKAYILEKKMYNTAIRYLWKMFREPVSSRPKVVLEIVEVAERFPQWQIVILILCQLQTDHNFHARQRCKDAVLLIFKQCFKMPLEIAETVLNCIIYD